MKKIRVIRKDSGLNSGSREVSLIEALKYLVYNPVQEKSILPQSSEAPKSGLTMSGSKKELIPRKFEFKGRKKFSGWK